MRLCKLVITLCLIGSAAYAQHDFYINYNADNGLVSNTIYRIQKTGKGFIWITTDKGISRFDGNTFRNFTIKDSMPDNEVFEAVVDPNQKDMLYFRAFSGKIFRIDEKYSTVENLDSLYNQPIHAYKIHNLFFYNDKIAVQNNPDSLMIISKDTVIKHRFPKKYNISKFLDLGDKIVISTQYNGEYMLLDKNTDALEMMIIPESDLGYYFIKFQDIQKINNHTFMGMTRNQVFTYDIRNRKFESLYTLNTENELVAAVELLGDNLYIGTNASVIRYHIPSGESEKILSGQTIQIITSDEQQNIYIGTMEGGIFLFPNVSVIHKEIFPLDNMGYINDFAIWDTLKYIRYDNANICFYNDHNKVLENFTGDFLDNEMSLMDCFLYNNRFHLLRMSGHYVGTPGQSVLSKIVNGPTTGYGFYKNKVFVWGLAQSYSLTGTEISDHINYDSRRSLGLLRNDTLIMFTKDSVTLYSVTQHTCIWSIPQTITSNRIVKIQPIDSRYYYVLDHLNIVHIVCIEGKGTQKHSEHKIDDDPISFIHYYNGQFYIAGDHTLKIKQYDIKSDTIIEKLVIDLQKLGLKNYKINVYNGVPYIIMRDAVLRIDIDQLSLLPEQKLALYIDEIYNNRKELDYWKNGQIFSIKNNNISIRIGAISHYHISDIAYYYKINGSEWVLMNSNELSLANLREGSYEIFFMAKDENGNTSDIIAYTFEVLPPFSRTIWFRILVILSVILITSLVFYIIVRRNRKAESQKQLFLQNIEELRMKALRNQINPHFLFNSLSAIQYLVIQGKKTEAVNYLNSFSSLFRTILENSDKKYSSLSLEFGILEKYTDIESLRFNRNISLSILYDSRINPDQVMIPAMILQPFIENSIVHGFFQSQEESCNIHILFRWQPDFLEVEIIDNGIGIHRRKKEEQKYLSGKTKSMGTDIVKRRLEILSEKQSTGDMIRYTDLSDEPYNFHGTKVSLKIPYIQSLL